MLPLADDIPDNNAIFSTNLVIMMSSVDDKTGNNAIFST